MMKNKKDNKIIFALTVGISTMMALNTGITAYAESEDAVADTNTPSETVEQNVEAPVTEVQESAEQVVEQVQETTEAVDTAASSAEEMMTQMSETVTPDDGGTVAAPAVEALAQEVEQAQEEQLVENIQEASETVEEVSTQVEEAVVYDTTANEAAVETVEAVNEVVTTADNMAGLVEDTNAKADDLVETIENTDDKDVARDTYTELETLVAQTQETVDQQQAYIDEMTQQYDDAKQKLLEAEANYEEAINAAEGNIEEAEDALVQAKETVENIESALEEAQDKLDYEKAAADAINDATLICDWGSQRAYLKLLVVNYIIPQMEGEMIDPDTVVVKRPASFDTQDYNYYSFTYTDSQGNEVTRFFNYDRADKKLSKNRYSNLGTSEQIVVYEKSQDEIEANNHLFDYYDGASFTRNELTSMANSGQLDVFVYEDADNNKTYWVREELNAAIERGDVVQTPDGYVFTQANEELAGTVVTEVVQAANSKVRGGEYIIDTSNAPDLETFLANADATANQYQALSSVVTDTKEAVESAQDEVDELKGAIGTLKNKHGNPVLKAVDALGVNDVATYLGIEVTQDQADVLNNMTVREAIAYLDAMLAGANAKVEEATATLNTLNEKLDEIALSLTEDEVIVADAIPGTEAPSAETAGTEVVIEEVAVPMAADVIAEDVIPATPAAPSDEAVAVAMTAIAPSDETLTADNMAVADAETAAQEVTIDQAALEMIAMTPVTETSVIGDAQLIGEATTIEDGEAILAAGIEMPQIEDLNSIEAAIEETQTAQAQISDAVVPRAPKIIDDEASAKTAFPTTQNTQKKDLFWWWLLILAGAIAGSRDVSEKVKRVNER
ncbi:hypothetical protein [Butyrivibrio fibrisolvens]|uniref:hypothetical protein n=1 Tax=Butyrivibrio fibrisolvens TaxID=831 RepID=UPI0003B624A6|nr:hypothetical protein [Butyrivibrio fibrisolvens]